MSRPLPIFFAARARREAVEARNWWRRNREKAPLAFVQELEKALDLLGRQPSVGARATNARLPGVRRLLLGRVHFYLYYRVWSEPARIEVLAIWHSARGADPIL